MQMATLDIKTAFGDSLTISFENEVISIDAYLIGSITGGTGTEKKSEVTGDGLKALLHHYSVKTPQDLYVLLKESAQEEREEFIKVLSTHEKITFIWSETDWSDD